MSRRRAVFLFFGLALAVLLMRHPHADIRVLTHDSTDPAPHRVQAALDIGVMALNVLVTWTVHRLV